MMTARPWGPALVLLALVSCARDTTPPPQKDTGKLASKAEAKPEGQAKAEAGAGPSFDANNDPPPTTAASTPEAPAEPVVDPADPLGRKFADPGWFRKDMLEGATAQNVSRSERTAAGLFSSQMLFDMPAGTTAETCADQVTAKIGTEVPNLSRAADDKVPGRIKITGETPRYRVTSMCGEAKGVMRAYVSFEWLN
jgi:hypothetical protein